MHEFCKECVDKKHNTGTAIGLEVADLSGASNSNADISNERHVILHNNYDEVIATIANERHDMLRDNSDEGNMTIANETCEIFQNKSDEGSASIMQDFEEVEEAWMRNNSTTNDSKSDDFFENSSSQ